MTSITNQLELDYKQYNLTIDTSDTSNIILSYVNPNTNLYTIVAGSTVMECMLIVNKGLGTYAPYLN